MISISIEISQEHFPRTVNDAYLTGMYMDQEDANMVYYTTQMGIHSYNQATKGKDCPFLYVLIVQMVLTFVGKRALYKFLATESFFTFYWSHVHTETITIIGGLLSVTIHGFNLGATLRDIKTITVGGQVCTSIIHASPESVTCMIVLREVNTLYSTINNVNGTYVRSITEKSTSAELLASVVPYTVDQVVFTTVGGSTTGVHNTPLTVVRSGSGRPVMSSIRLTVEPFAPYTLTVASHPVESSDAKSVSYEKTLYWSNVAYGAYSIQRSRMDGTQVETVVNNVSIFNCNFFNVSTFDRSLKQLFSK